MYCYHCGLKINERKLEAKAPSYSLVEEEMNETPSINYVCPRCGHLIHEGCDEKDYKSLSQAAHSQVQRGRNHFAFGMSFVSVGVILAAIAIIFFVLAHKPTNQYKLVATCTEFYVSVVLFVISLALLIAGIVYVVLGLVKKQSYTKLLKDLNNKTFVQ